MAGAFYYGSNAVSNSFAADYYLGRFIDDKAKEDVISNLKNSNRFGLSFDAFVSYTRRNDSVFSLRNSSYTFSIGTHYHIESRFNEDAFKLYFKGNKGFAGKTANVSDFTYNQLSWQYLNFTFGHEFKYGLNKYGYSAGIGFLKGQKLYRIETDRANIFTEEIGSYLDLDAHIKINQSDSGKNSLTDFNGAGFELNFSGFWTDKKRNTLSFSIDNMGMIFWNGNSAFVEADTSLRFEGIDISYLLDFRDTIRKTISVDSALVQPYLDKRVYKSYTSMLPSLIHVNYQYILRPGRIDAEAGINYLIFSEAIPQEYIRINYTLQQRHRMSLMMRYGGYSAFQAGLAYKLWFLDRWLFTIRGELGWNDNFMATAYQATFLSLSAYF